MIRVTDKTLSSLDRYGASSEQLEAMSEFLIDVGVDYIEFSKDAYNRVKKLPKGGKYILKIDDISDVPYYNEFNRFVCRHSGFVMRSNVINEIQINDINEINSLCKFKNLPDIRLTGLDDIMCHDYKTAAEQIHKNLTGKIELCPENGYYCATAIAVEWVLSGGRDITTSLCGIGGFAPTEEVVMALHLLARYKPTQDYSVFSSMRQLIEEITGETVPSHKPVIGKDIFHVEAGIHADGIAKDPHVYEPYSPELVGAKREFIMGKHSGKSAVILKMIELGLTVDYVKVPKILEKIRINSINKEESLTNEEFINIVKAM